MVDQPAPSPERCRGRCLCGAVSFEATLPSDEFSACHCKMCQRWAGGPLISVRVEGIEWQGQDHIGVYASSEWAERWFCNQCGSSLAYCLRSKEHGDQAHVALGLLEGEPALRMTREWFVDRKPDSYGFAGEDERERLTEAEVFARFSP